jgi:hypothetical protein
MERRSFPLIVLSAQTMWGQPPSAVRRSVAPVLFLRPGGALAGLESFCFPAKTGSSFSRLDGCEQPSVSSREAAQECSPKGPKEVSRAPAGSAYLVRFFRLSGLGVSLTFTHGFTPWATFFAPLRGSLTWFVADAAYFFQQARPQMLCATKRLHFYRAPR